MKLTKVTGCGGGSCPTVYRVTACGHNNCPSIHVREHDTLIVQGYLVAAETAGIELGAGERLVEIPASLIDDYITERDRRLTGEALN